MPNDKKKLAAPCGLYCGNCSELLLDETCHGCGCECGLCAAGPHRAACALYRCITEKGLESCAACDDLPCTRLIQFAYDPIWRTHLPILENKKVIGMISMRDLLGAQLEEYTAQARFLSDYISGSYG